MTTATAIIKQITDTSDHVGTLPTGSIPVITISDSNAKTSDLNVLVITQEGNTAGIVIVPMEWERPDDCGIKLVVPPDSKGWRLLDRLKRAGFNDIVFTAS